MTSRSGEIRLGGRLFSMVNYDHITARNEHYVMKWMRSTELDKVLPAGSESEEPDSAYLARLQAKLNDTLEMPEVLAGYLLPAGKTEKDWSREMAAETAKYIGDLDTQEDRDEVQRLGLLVVFDFFRVGIASLKRSENALKATIPTSQDQSPPRPAVH